MKSLSLDLPNLAKEVDSLTQQKLILESTIQGSQKEWDARKKKIAQQTKSAIEKSQKSIKEATAVAEAELQSIRGAIENEKIVLADAKSSTHNTIESLKGEIEHLAITKRQLFRDIDECAIEKERLVASTDTLKIGVIELKDSKSTLEKEISGLDANKNTITTELSDLSSKFKREKGQFDTQLESCRIELKALEKDIELLTLKKAKITREMNENAKLDEIARERIANRLVLLDDREKNLRIREERVAQQEETISRNHTLLNL